MIPCQSLLIRSSVLLNLAGSRRFDYNHFQLTLSIDDQFCITFDYLPQKWIGFVANSIHVFFDVIKRFFVQCLTPRWSKQGLYGGRTWRFHCFIDVFDSWVSRAWCILNTKVTGTDSTKPKLSVNGCHNIVAMKTIHIFSEYKQLLNINIVGVFNNEILRLYIVYVFTSSFLIAYHSASIWVWLSLIIK